jgi:mono/diheme cytochrome c family protein
VKRFLAVALLAGIALAQNPAYQQDPRWHAPDEAIARQNPLANRPEAAAGGRKLFLRNCAECHRPDGAGMESKHSADFQLPLVQTQTDGTLFWKITNGNASHGMPSFSKLPELQRWQLVLYIRTLKAAGVDATAQDEKSNSQSR